MLKKHRVRGKLQKVHLCALSKFWVDDSYSFVCMQNKKQRQYFVLLGQFNRDCWSSFFFTENTLSRAKKVQNDDDHSFTLAMLVILTFNHDEPSFKASHIPFNHPWWEHSDDIVNWQISFVMIKCFIAYCLLSTAPIWSGSRTSRGHQQPSQIWSAITWPFFF